MPTCAIIGCTSGYHSNSEKCHIFTVPRDAKVRELWEKAVKPSGREIEPGQSVCQKHFLAEEIMWERKLVAPDGTLLGISKYKVPRLKQGSVPSVFPWTELIESQTSEVNMVTEEQAVTLKTCTPPNEDATDQSAIQLKVGDECLPGCMPHQSDDCTLLSESMPDRMRSVESSMESKKIDTTTLQNLNTDKSTRSLPPLIFQELIPTEISMPAGWNKHLITHEHVTFVVYSIMKCFKAADNLITFILKEVILKPDMTFQINVLGKPMEKKDPKIDLSPIDSIQKLQELLCLLNRLNVCTGTKLSDEQNRSIGSSVYKDPSGTWRHVGCSLLGTTSVCPSCRTARKSAMAKSRRTEKHSDAIKRIRLNVSSKDKSLLEKLKKRNRASQKNALRARNKVTRLERKIKNSQEQMSNNTKSLESYLKSANLSQNQTHVLREILAAAKCKKSRGRRYSEEWILLCMLLYMRSPAGYKFLRNNGILPLPHVRTVRRYLTKLDTACGFDARFFEILKLSLAKKDEIQKHGILLIDEMATRESLNVDTKTLSFKGLIDFGKDGEQVSDLTQKANHGLVIMFHPLADNYTQPIAVFASRGPVKGDDLGELILKSIVLLENVGAKVHGVVTDGASTNRKFWSTVGVSGHRKSFRNFFEHPTVRDRRIFVFSDSPHLMKTIRNRLYEKKVLQMCPTEHLIKWEDIEILYKKDRELVGPARPVPVLMCPKLTKNHIELNNTAKMRVRLAVQVLSKTVARGLRFFKGHVPELKTCEGTAAFCEWNGIMFDALNRKKSTEGVRPGDVDFQIIQDSISKLDAWTENVEKGLISKDRFLTQQTAEGLRVTLHSTLDIVTYLVNNCNFPYVLTGQINQDSLERYFGTVRQAGGCNDHPSSYTFLQIHRILSTFSILKPPETGNCSISQDDPHQPLVTLAELKTIYKNPKKSDLSHSIKKRLSEAAKHESWTFADVVEHDQHDNSKTEVSDCILYYMTVQLTRQILTTVKCVECKQAFLGSETSARLPESNLAASLVDRPLIHPNINLYRFVLFLEQSFSVHCRTTYLFESILEDVYAYQKLSFPCAKHAGEILLHVIQSFVRIRMQQYCSQINSEKKKDNQSIKKVSKHYKT